MVDLAFAPDGDDRSRASAGYRLNLSNQSAARSAPDSSAL